MNGTAKPPRKACGGVMVKGDGSLPVGDITEPILSRCLVMPQ